MSEKEQGMEVVGYLVDLPNEPELGHWLDEEAEEGEQICRHQPLVRQADAERVIDQLRAEVEALRGIVPDFPPRPPDGEGLPRYGLRWNGPQQPLSVPMADGYWTPWHLANCEVEALRKDAREQCRSAYRAGWNDAYKAARNPEMARKEAEEQAIDAAMAAKEGCDGV